MIDQKNQEYLRKTIEAFYFGYRQFTSIADEVIEERGLNRVHHRILYFVGQNPGIGVGGLLEILQVSKQALNLPLRQLLEMQFITNEVDENDRRIRRLQLSDKGKELEMQLTQMQMSLMEDALNTSPEGSGEGWLSIMTAIKDAESKS
jgi:DNA-binding MarR family transcriptional regulator